MKVDFQKSGSAVLVADALKQKRAELGTTPRERDADGILDSVEKLLAGVPTNAETTMAASITEHIHDGKFTSLQVYVDLTIIPLAEEIPVEPVVVPARSLEGSELDKPSRVQ